MSKTSEQIADILLDTWSVGDTVFWRIGGIATEPGLRSTICEIFLKKEKSSLTGRLSYLINGKEHFVSFFNHELTRRYE